MTYKQYTIKYENGKYVIYDKDGEFVARVDTIEEAHKEIDENEEA